MDKGFGQRIKWDTPLLEGYDYEFLPNISPTKTVNNRFFDLINPGILNVLLKHRGSIVIIHDWTYLTVVFCIIIGKMSGSKIWLRAENPLNQELTKSRTVLLLKRFYLKYFLFRFFVDKFLYIGSQNRDFYQYYGVSHNDLIFTPYAVDNAYFSRQFKQLGNSVERVKKEMHIGVDECVILFSGKFIPKKRPLDLLKAFHLLKFDRKQLIFMGDGELRGEMEDYIAENAIKNVLITGFINQSEISRYYAVCDVFVMCSGMGETWGLSVNEAMNFNKPVIVSSTCGCSFDLVVEGSNGYRFEEGNISQLAYYLDILLSDKEFRERAGKASGEIVKQFCYERGVQNMVNILVP